MSLWMLNEINKLKKQLAQMPSIVVSVEEPENPSENLVWMKPKNDGIPVPDYLFRFDAATLLLADSAPVTEWVDLSGNGYDVFGTSTAPTYSTTGLGGKPTVVFSGSDRLASSTFSFDRLDGLTVFLIAEADVGSGSTTALAIGDSSSNDHSYLLRRSGSSQAIASHIGTAVNGAAAEQRDGMPTLYTANYDQNETKMYTNGVYSNQRAATGDLQQADKLVLGSRLEASQFFEGKISEVIYFSRVLTLQEMADMNTYLMDKWGIV